MISADEYEETGLFLEHNGMSDDEIDEFFAHHGIKGMKWGKRKARKEQERTNYLSSLTEKQQKSFLRRETAKKKARKNAGKAVAKALPAAAALAAGQYLVNRMLFEGGPTGMVAERSARKNRKFVNDMMTMHGKIKVADLNYAVRKSAIDVNSRELLSLVR